MNPPTQKPSTEFVWCLDTANRDVHHVPEEPNNPTNDVRIPLNLSINRVTVSSLELATLELPRAQRLIEPQWNRFFTADAMFFQSRPCDPLCNLVLRDRCNDFVASVPDGLNPVTAMDVTDPDNPVFTTRKPHLLASHLQYWVWGEPVELIGTPRTIRVSEEGRLHPDVTVLGPMTFTVALHGTEWRQSSTATCWGFIHYPAFPSPVFLAHLLTDRLRAEMALAQNKRYGEALRVQYDTGKGGFSITWKSERMEIPTEAILVADNPGSIATYIGFSAYNTAFATQDVPYTIHAPGCIGTVSYCEISPGTYNAPELAEQIDFQCNRFWLEPRPVHLTKSTDVATNEYQLQFGTDAGDVRTIYIPSGLYNPVTFATTLTELFGVAWPAGRIEVEWSCKNSVFMFISISEIAFSLEFQPSSGTNIASRMGFEPVRYTTETMYMSCNVVPVPRYRGNQGGLRYISAVCTTTVNAKALKFLFHLSRAPCLPYTSTTAAPEGGMLTITNTRRAHGFQVGDIVTVDHGNLYRFPVIRVLSGTSFVLDLGSVVFPTLEYDILDKTFSPGVGVHQLVLNTTFPTLGAGTNALFTSRGVAYAGRVTGVDGDNTTLDFSPHVLPLAAAVVGGVAEEKTTLRVPFAVYGNSTPKLNLLFTPKPRSCRPSILGFPATDMLWTSNITFQSPLTYRLQAASYILVEMVVPTGSARIEHNYKGDNNTNILGKIVILPTPWLERFYPMKATFLSNIKLGYVHFRLLNPDHTLYQLHGHEWSATIRLNCLA